MSVAMSVAMPVTLLLVEEEAMAAAAE